MNNNVLEHIYITKEMAHVGSVKFQGLDKVNPREAREKFAVELGEIFASQMMYQKVKKVAFLSLY